MYTLADGVARYLASIENAHTVKTYQSVLDRVLSHFGDDTSLESVTTARLWRLLHDIHTGDHAYSTKRLYTAVIKAFFSHLTALGVYQHNPAAKVRSLPPQAAYNHRSRLTRKERLHLFDTAADNPRNLAMLRLIADTGLSSVEIASLTPGDVSPAARFVVYHESGLAWRVSFSDSTAAALYVWDRVRSDESASLFDLSPAGVLQVISRAYKAAGVRKLGIKGLPVAPVHKVDGTNKIIHMRVNHEA